MCQGKVNTRGSHTRIDPGYIQTIRLKNLLPSNKEESVTIIAYGNIGVQQLNHVLNQ